MKCADYTPKEHLLKWCLKRIRMKIISEIKIKNVNTLTEVTVNMVKNATINIRTKFVPIQIALMINALQDIQIHANMVLDAIIIDKTCVIILM